LFNFVQFSLRQSRARREEQTMSSNVREIAKLAGVSVGTVFNVLHNPEKVRGDKSEKVRAAVELLRYEAPRPRGKAVGKVIGVATADVSSYLYHPAVKAIEEVLNQNGYHMILKSTDRDIAKEIQYLKVLEEASVDGVIIISAPEISHYHHIYNLKEKDVPIILINRSTEDPMISHVELDAFRGGFAATEHLIKLGHKHIAYISSPVQQRENNGFWRRFRGYRWALEHYGLPFDKQLFAAEGGDKFQTGCRLAEKMYRSLGAANMPTAAFVANDVMALAAINVWQKKGMNIPGDISVIGFNNQPFGEYFQNGLTTVNMPFHKAGEIAARHILKELAEGRSELLSEVLPCELVLRGTTKAIASVSGSML
jgi:LacI family transcriptional regulator